MSVFIWFFSLKSQAKILCNFLSSVSELGVLQFALIPCLKTLISPFLLQVLVFLLITGRDGSEEQASVHSGHRGGDDGINGIRAPEADKLEEVGDDPGKEIDHIRSVARSIDCVGLDPKMRSDARELAGNSWNSQKD